MAGLYGLKKIIFTAKLYYEFIVVCTGINCLSYVWGKHLSNQKPFGQIF